MCRPVPRKTDTPSLTGSTKGHITVGHRSVLGASANGPEAAVMSAVSHAEAALCM